MCVFFCFRAELQIETTQDYATDNWFLNVFTGSFSEQVMPTGLFTFVFITSSSSKIISEKIKQKIHTVIWSPFLRDVPLLENLNRLKMKKEQQKPTLAVHFGRLPSY